MKKLLLITSAALIGLASQATAALTVDTPVPSSALATELRSYTKADWATINNDGGFTAMGMYFGRNDGVDDGGVALVANQSILVESIFKAATFINVFAEQSEGKILVNTDLTQSAKVTTDIDDNLTFFFDTDLTDSSPSENAGAVGLDANKNVWTYTNPAKTSSPTYYLWMLEDYNVDAGRRDDDFNDFIVLGTVSAVPEPSTIISLIAVGFLGFVTWRNRRKAKA